MGWSSQPPPGGERASDGISGSSVAGVPLSAFGSYRLVWLLGQGGMAELYLALRCGIEGFEKVVALKRVLPSITEEPSFVRMFLDEARLAARLDHPNIVRIYDLGEIERQYFIAMEYLPGEDVRTILQRARQLGARIPVDVAVYIAHEAATALDFAHRLTDTTGEILNLVHRDVSPSNIIVTYYGAVKLVDFGIAKARNSSVQTEAGAFKGKLPYSAPEQLRGAAADARSDVFSLGIVLWELLVGRRLFQRENYAGIIEAVRSAEIPPPSSLRPDVPPELDQIVARALERSRGRRYQSALEMQLDLERILARYGGQRTSRSIGEWLERLHGADRAEAKKALAQGKNLDAPIPGVMQPLGPRSRAAARSPAPQSDTPPALGRPASAPVLGPAGSSPPGAAGSSPAPELAGPAGIPTAQLAGTADPSPRPPLDALGPLGGGAPLWAPPVPAGALGHSRTPMLLGASTRDIAGSTPDRPVPLAPSLQPLEDPDEADGQTLAARPLEAEAHLARSISGDVSVLRPALNVVVASVAAVLVVFSLVGIGIAFWLARNDGARTLDAPRAAAAARHGAETRAGLLEIESEPAGAAIFLDGEPTGLSTPARLNGMATHRPISIRLELDGYASARDEVALRPGEVSVKRFALQRAVDATPFPQ